MNPNVSVILPYYEGLRWLPRAVESVRQQTEKTWELIVVDDGSEEDPGPFLQRLDDNRVKFFRINHAGKGAALNHGVGNARGEMVCFIDQDDIMLPGRLATQLRGLEHERHADGVYSDYERRHEDGRFIDRFISWQVTPEEAVHQMAVGRGPVTMQTIMLKKAFYEELGGFSNQLELTGLDDLEFFVRLFLSQPVMVYAPGVVQGWVLHERNYSKTRDFQEARLHWLARLAELARLHPMLEKELKHYRFHSHCMRGMYFLETGYPGYAVADLFKALRLNPFSLNTSYLFIKALSLTTAGHFGANVLAPKINR
ncbi:MAG TPA: glycosyltransferase family A protein [Desulfobacterales bacterium]|nr:glycosyltransferase family A protein [Desulfobacterales bacterium]